MTHFEDDMSADELDEALEQAFEAQAKKRSSDQSIKLNLPNLQDMRSLGAGGVRGEEPQLSRSMHKLITSVVGKTKSGKNAEGKVPSRKHLDEIFGDTKAVGKFPSKGRAEGSLHNFLDADVTKEGTFSGLSREVGNEPRHELGKGSGDFWSAGLESVGSLGRAPPPAQISFQFPDWGVDFGKKGANRTSGPGMENIASADIEAPHGRSVPAGSSLRTGNDPSVPTSTCGFHTLPDEVLLSIFRKLATIKDICSCILVCSKWEELIGGDEIWAGLLAQRFGNQEYARGGARLEFKRCTMVRAIGGRFQVLKKGFEYLAAALDAWWASGALSDAALPYNQATVRRIIGKLTASNWALLYEGFGALFIARADKLALELLDLLASAETPDATPPTDPPTSSQAGPDEKHFLSTPSHTPFSSLRDATPSPSLLNPNFSPTPLNPKSPSENFKRTEARRTNQQVSTQRSPKPVSNVKLTSGSFSDDLLEAFGRGPAKRPKTGYSAVNAPGVPISELVARAESEPEGRGWGRGLRGLAEAGVNPDDVAEALASGELYNSVDSAFETANWDTGGLETGSIPNGTHHLEGSLCGVETRNEDGLDTWREGLGLFPRVDREGVGAETIDGAQGKPPSSPFERKQSGSGSQSVAQGRVLTLHRKPKAGRVGAALWREVLRVWRRHRAFVLLVSEQCESLNIEVLRERARAHAVAATPTVFDQGALCFRGQILLRHKIRRPLQAGLAWLTMRAISGDATDKEYELLKDIRHMRQEIDVRDDFTLTKATFTQAKFRRCFCNV